MHYEHSDPVLQNAALTSYDDQPTRLEMAAAMFTKKATGEAFGTVHARSIRIPTMENVSIEALAIYSGMSVNKVIVELLQVALDEVFQAFDPADREAIFKVRGPLIKELLDESGFIKKSVAQAEKGEI